MVISGEDSSPKEVVICGYEDIILARQYARQAAQHMGFSVMDQTKIVTAVSELARNIVVHAGKGKMIATRRHDALVLRFQDNGPGIVDINKALSKGFSTTNSLGLGLSGAKALSDSFDIQSAQGQGTSITIAKYLRKH
ncbi:anti-sigma regulatory factor [Megalodesulfovibrio gigas]|uniref:Putative anti-sigma regulatory factor n=1 Tax=Megalodesulfovibrio gigas (strain ATCC 19364 / DSM 1382 / NCIMB 9332 / VKM B-1759) TaxID=1121448 RepID=T2GFI0_MEGG1|nr:anti-sigma regulatory factor [Megalodesulfovibrio gigas]AGW14939.1 putative anti-sigma regulatory factor [Megalodesulfovibrio gigas DSM 1382 = ATCC 19364]